MYIHTNTQRLVVIGGPCFVYNLPARVASGRASLLTRMRFVPKIPKFLQESGQEVGDRNPAFGRRDLLGWESTALETAWKLPNLVIVDILGDFPKTYDELFRNSKQQR